MRALALLLAALIVLIQYPLWFGKGGWFRLKELDRQLQAQREANARLAQRNAALDAEVRDLKQGSDAIEERARYELGMIRPGEIFFQVVPAQAAAPAPSPAPSLAAAAQPSAPEKSAAPAGAAPH